VALDLQTPATRHAGLSATHETLPAPRLIDLEVAQVLRR